MSLRNGRGRHRDLHVQWADEAEAPVASRQIGSALISDDGADSNEGDDEACPLPPRKISRHYPSLLQQALPTSPVERRLYCKTFDRDDESSEEEMLERREVRSCTSGSACSWASYSSSDDTEATYSRESFEDSQAAATTVKERCFREFAGGDALGTAPMHASSSLLSSGSLSFSFRQHTCDDLAPPLSPVMETGEANINSRAARGFKWRLERYASSSSRSLSPESSSTTASPHREGRGSLYSPMCASALSDLSPSPAAVFRSKNCDSSYACTPSSRNYLHSSTAVHEPRARCGCRGLTVRVDSGPLGLSLEASYRMQQGFMLKQAWSDCAMDKAMFTHSIHVQNLPGKRGDGHVGALDLGLEGRSSSSGLIKVRKVGIEGVGGAATVASSNNDSVLVGPPSPLRPGVMSKEARSGVLVGVLEVEEGDILVRVDNVQVTKKSFTEVVTLLDQAKRPTRLTFVRHACGRRFVGREKGGGGSCRCASSAAGRRVPPLGSVLAIGLAGCCGKWGMPRCGCEQPKRSSSIGQPALSPSPQKQNTRYRQTEAEADGCPVAVLLRARCQLRSGGIGEWHEVVASRGRLWQRLLRTMSLDSQSDRAKLRKLTGGSRSIDDHLVPGMTGMSKRKLTSTYQRLIGSRKSARNGGDFAEADRALATRVWNDVHRTMSPRRPGGRPGFFSASASGGGGHVCPAHFAGGSQHAVFRVAYATASTVQFVSGMSYMAALMLVQEPVEAMAYATLVTLLQERMMQSLFPMGDVDLLDAYHLCGGRVVTFRASGVARSPAIRRQTSSGRGGDDVRYPYRGRGYRCTERGEVPLAAGGASEVSSRDNQEVATPDDGAPEEPHGRGNSEQEEEPIQQVVVGEMLPRLVRAFGKALRRRLPALHNHLCEQAIPMSFLCAEWFTTAYARNTPLPLALCAFDLFLVRFDDVMLRLGLAILEVLAPALKKLNGVEILLQYGGLTANVCFEEVLRCALATQPRQPPLMPAPTPKIPFRLERRSADSCVLS